MSEDSRGTASADDAAAFRRDFEAQVAAGRQPPAAAQLQYARSLVATGEPAAAAALYRQLLAQTPSAALWLEAGNLWRELGWLELAAQAYREALSLNADSAPAWVNLAMVLLAQGQFAQARVAIEQTLARVPEQAIGWGLRARLGQSEGLLSAAEADLRRALTLAPADAGLWNQLGGLLQDDNRALEAAEAFGVALKHQPQLSLARLNLALLQREQGEAEAAQRGFDALALPAASFLAAAVLPPMLDTADEAHGWARRLQQRLEALVAAPVTLRDPLREVGRLPFYLPYLGVSERPLMTLLGQAYTAACPRLVWQAAHLQRARRPGRPRLAIVSAHFYDHTVTRLLAHLYAALAAADCELALFAASPRSDAVTAGLRQQAAHFETLPPDIFAARERIAAWEPDLLLYSELGMDPLCYFLAFARLAPVQVVTMGHVITTGLPTIDFFLLGEALVPVGGETAYSEALLRLPHMPIAWQPPESLPSIALPLPSGRRYLCPQFLPKFHPDFDVLLAELLAQDPAAQLILLDGRHPAWKARLLKRWSGRLDTDRIHWLPPLSAEAFLALLQAGDVLLDPRPFGGGLTSLQALALGTPLVTWPAQGLQGRVSYGACCSLDWHEGVSASARDYVSRAQALAEQASPRRRQQLQQRYRERMQGPAIAADAATALLGLVRS